MEQKDFNQIQSNFKKFLTENLPPLVITKSKPLRDKPSEVKISAIEKTCAFGSQDSEIGYLLESNNGRGILTSK